MLKNLKDYLKKDREIIWKVDKLFEKHKKLFRKLIEI